MEYDMEYEYIYKSISIIIQEYVVTKYPESSWIIVEQKAVGTSSDWRRWKKQDWWVCNYVTSLYIVKESVCGHLSNSLIWYYFERVGTNQEAANSWFEF